MTVNRTHYGLFAPSGATWLPADASVDAVHSELAGKDYFSVAVLPDENPNTIKAFAKYAFAFVADTEVTYQYTPQASAVKTTYTVTTNPKEGSETRTVMALYRHQHLHLVDTTKHTPFAEFNRKPTRKNESHRRRLVYYLDTVLKSVAFTANAQRIVCDTPADG